MDEKMLLQAIQQIVKTEIEPLNGRMDEMSGRMDEMSSRIDRMENRMDRIEMRMDRMEGRMDRVEILLEHEIPKQLQLLAEGHQGIVARLPKEHEMEDLHSRVSSWSGYRRITVTRFAFKMRQWNVTLAFIHKKPDALLYTWQGIRFFAYAFPMRRRLCCLILLPEHRLAEGFCICIAGISIPWRAEKACLVRRIAGRIRYKSRSSVDSPSTSAPSRR